MYFIPLALFIVLAMIAVAWSPIFALIIFVPAFVAFLFYVGASRRADEKLAPPEQPGRQSQHENETPTGIWGERRPS
jgi:hypothetical protein